MQFMLGKGSAHAFKGKVAVADADCSRQGCTCQGLDDKLLGCRVCPAAQTGQQCLAGRRGTIPLQQSSQLASVCILRPRL